MVLCGPRPLVKGFLVEWRWWHISENPVTSGLTNSTKDTAGIRSCGHTRSECRWSVRISKCDSTALYRAVETERLYPDGRISPIKTRHQIHWADKNYPHPPRALRRTRRSILSTYTSLNTPCHNCRSRSWSLLRSIKQIRSRNKRSRPGAKGSD